MSWREKLLWWFVFLGSGAFGAVIGWITIEILAKAP